MRKFLSRCADVCLFVGRRLQNSAGGFTDQMREASLVRPSANPFDDCAKWLETEKQKLTLEERKEFYFLPFFLVPFFGCQSIVVFVLHRSIAPRLNRQSPLHICCKKVVLIAKMFKNCLHERFTSAQFSSYRFSLLKFPLLSSEMQNPLFV